MKFKGVQFDYGHAHVWFPHYRKIQLLSVRNMQRRLRALGVNIEASRIQAAIDKFTHRRRIQQVGIAAESRQILSSVGAKEYSETIYNRL